MQGIYSMQGIQISPVKAYPKTLLQNKLNFNTGDVKYPPYVREGPTYSTYVAKKLGQWLLIAE